MYDGLHQHPENIIIYGFNNAYSNIDPWGLLSIIWSGGFHIPLSPGYSIGPSGSFVWNNGTLVWNPPVKDTEIGGIADIGYTVSVGDLSNSNEPCPGATVSYGIGKYDSVSITFRNTPDLSRSSLDPGRYIDGFGLGVGVGLPFLKNPVTVSGP
jgi:hypothetical protein